MPMRIRNQWKHNPSEKTLEDKASALAYTAWQIALTAAKNLHAEKFNYESDEQRVGVIAEYLIYLTHITDRLSHAILEDQTRNQLIQLVAQEVARQYQSNVEQVMGKRDYKEEFLVKLNARANDYSCTSFEGQTPGYDMRRMLAYAVQQIMGNSQTNKWVMDQVIEIDSVEMVQTYTPSYRKLIDNVEKGTSQ